MEQSSPEEPLPGGEVGALEERVLQDALHPTQGLDHVRAVVVQVPELPIMALVGPPEWVLLQHLGAGGERRGPWEGLQSSGRLVIFHTHPLPREGMLGGGGGRRTNLVLLEIRPDSPALVVGQSVPVLLEEGVDAWDASVPRVLQVLQGQAPATGRRGQGWLNHRPPDLNYRPLKAQGPSSCIHTVH